MSVGTKRQSGGKAWQPYRGDHAGSQGQVDARGHIVIPVIEQQGVVRPDELFTLEAFKHRLGITDSTMRKARRNGLRVYYRHKLAYVYGRDWIDYVLYAPGEKSQLVTC